MLRLSLPKSLGGNKKLLAVEKSCLPRSHLYPPFGGSELAPCPPEADRLPGFVGPFPPPL
jgi:hypothetical protein